MKNIIKEVKDAYLDYSEAATILKDYKIDNEDYIRYISNKTQQQRLDITHFLVNSNIELTIRNLSKALVDASYNAIDNIDDATPADIKALVDVLLALMKIKQTRSEEILAKLIEARQVAPSDKKEETNDPFGE